MFKRCYQSSSKSSNKNLRSIKWIWLWRAMKLKYLLFQFTWAKNRINLKSQKQQLIPKILDIYYPTTMRRNIPKIVNNFHTIIKWLQIQKIYLHIPSAQFVWGIWQITLVVGRIPQTTNSAITNIKSNTPFCTSARGATLQNEDPFYW